MTQKKTHTYLRSMFFLLLLFFLLVLLSRYFLPKGNTLEDGIQEPELYAFLGSRKTVWRRWCWETAFP